MNKTTQDMKYKQSLMHYAQKHGVSKAARKCNRSRSYIYFWLERYDGTVESLAPQSRRPHSHPTQHSEQELKLIRDMRRRNPHMGLIDLWCRLRARGYTRCTGSLYRVLRRTGDMPSPPPHTTYKPKPYQQMTYPGERVQIDVKVVPMLCSPSGHRFYQYTAIDEFTRLRYLGAYEEQNTYSSADFLKKAVTYYKTQGFEVKCVQTDNGFEFTNRLHTHEIKRLTLFELTAQELGIYNKYIKPYTPRHNGKVERSHREDQKRFYSCHRFYSFADFGAQLAVHQSRSNNRPMRPLQYNSLRQFLHTYTAQYV